MPPGGVGGGGRQKIKLTGRAKFAALGVHPSDSTGSDFPGAYDETDGVRVCLVVDPWSSVFASLGTNHVDGSYRAQQRTLLGWNPVDGARECGFEAGSGSDLRLLGGSPGYLFAGDATAVRLTQFDPDGAALPDIDNGATYWVDALGVANLGKYELYLDRSLATQVTSSAFTGSVVASVGASESLYALRFYFDIPPRVSYLRNADATASTDQISHPALASRVVGDALACLEADGSGLADGTTYYIINKPTATTAQISETQGGSAFDITSDADEVSFSYTDPEAINTEDYCRVEFEVECVGDGSSDNNESGVRWTAVMRIIPYSETVGPIVFGATASRGFKEYRGALSRTAPGTSSRDTAGSLDAVGAPQVLAKADYYTDGAANGYDAYYTSRWDYGGDYDLLHMNGDVLLHALATSGEYDFPLDSIQGVQAHGLSSQGRRATKTYVHRNGESAPVAEVVFYDQARRICAVRNLIEGEAICRGDELEFKTYRYVKVQNISASTGSAGMTWNASTKVLAKNNAFTNLPSGSSVIAITSAIAMDPNSVRASTPDFTPGFRTVTKIDNSSVTVTDSVTGLPSYSTSATTMTFGGYFEYSSGTSWDFSPVLAQNRDTVRGPRFTRGSYDNTTNAITIDAADLAGWTWYSGARVWITQGTGFTGLPAYFPITSATSTTITITGGPGATATNVIGQLETNIPLSPDMVDRGPQFTSLAVRVAVTGPPSGDCEVEINTYESELVDGGSR